ncbi:MAG TPA: TOBE domain-containing protein, partial [Usitatibacteraceae bacterium]|nr:TOBE domain-containing protein [Usitatibacteraceae bacterium]
GITTIMVTHDQEEALSMADRIVVMNKGRIEQVGTPLEIYRDPQTTFVVDFVGKVNLLDATVEAPGQLRVGDHAFACHALDAVRGRVHAYLRPEDIVARPIEPGDANVIDATIDKIEFLGPYCLVRALVAGLPQPLTVYLSLNYLSEMNLGVGSSLKLKILTERLRVFDR